MSRFRQVYKLAKHSQPQIVAEAGGPKIAGEILSRVDCQYWIFGGLKRDVDKLRKEFPKAFIEHKPHKELEAMTEVEEVDLAVIHETKRMREDFAVLKKAKTVVLDGYYVKEGKPVDKGCYSLIKDENHFVLPDADDCQVVVLGEKAKGAGNVRVKTKNCVPDTVIQGNVRYATTRIPPERFMPECEAHDEVAVMVSCGPSLEKWIPELKKRQKKGEKIICVKTAHNRLIENGIVPWGCMLLDPREDVVERITPINPDVKYFTASMVCPKVVDLLVDGFVPIHAYHALVGAGEMDVLSEYDKRVGGNSFALPGGSTAAIRGIFVLYSCGFRNFHLYAYDSCYWEKPDMDKKTKTGQPYHCEVTVNGRKFWTDSQLLAQVQDFENMLQKNMNINIEVHGDGMLAHVHQTVQRPKAKFKDVFG